MTLLPVAETAAVSLPVSWNADAGAAVLKVRVGFFCEFDGPRERTVWVRVTGAD